MARSAGFGPEFLRRLRIATAVVGTLGFLYVLLYAGVRPGLAVLSGLVLSISNLYLLERIFVGGLSPATLGEGSGRRIALALLLKFPLLFGGTALALGVLRLPALWFIGGFSLLLVVALLKVLGRLLMGDTPRKNARRAGRRWPALLAAAALGGGLLAAGTPALLRTALADEAPAASIDLAAGHAAAGAHAAMAAPEAAHPAEDRLDLAQHEAAPGQEHAAEGAPAGGSEERRLGGQEGETPETRFGETMEEGEAVGHGQGGERAPELPNFLHLLEEAFPNQAWAHTLSHWQNPIYAAFVFLFLCISSIVVYNRRTMIPGKMQNVAEMIVESFYNFIIGILGPRGKEFVPFLGTLFLYIWLNNLQGLVPLFKSPTSVYNTTIALAICVFFYVQYTGITKLGIGGYLHHMMGSPRDPMGWVMVPLMLPLHLIEEVAKPVSLSLRLFGNILGEDVLLGAFTTLGVAILAFTRLPIGLPLDLPFIFLSLLMSTIQALVFTLLATIYFSQMLPHEHEEHEEGPEQMHAQAYGQKLMEEAESSQAL